MSKSKHSEAQMIEALKQVEAGRSAEEVGRSYGVSKHTIYAWKSRHGGMEVSEAQEMKALREENARLKKLVANLSLDKDALDSNPKKPLGLAVCKAEVLRLEDEFHCSQRHACELMGIPRSTFRYRGRRDDSALHAKLVDVSREQPR